MSSKARDSYEDRRHVLDMHPEPPRLTSLYQKRGCQDRYLWEGSCMCGWPLGGSAGRGGQGIIPSQQASRIRNRARGGEDVESLKVCTTDLEIP